MVVHTLLFSVLVTFMFEELPPPHQSRGGRLIFIHTSPCCNSLFKEKLGVKVVSDSLVNEVMRGIRENLETLLPDVGVSGVR